MKHHSTRALQSLDEAHHLHPFTDNAGLLPDQRRVITRGEGVWLWDSDGNRLLDGMAGLWCAQIGHGRREIADAVHAQMTELSYYNTFFKTTHEPVVHLSAMLAELMPAHINKVFFGTSGSDSNDTALRVVRTYWDLMGKPDKKTIISRHNAYHGSTVAAASLGGMEKMHAQSGMPIPGITHIAQPYWFGEADGMDPGEFGIWAARELEREIDRLGEDRVAAFIAEPIQGAGGVIIPPETYWPEIRRILSEREILFISDEVICGFGRTGSWFGCQTYGTEPDLITMAKGMSSGYLPIAGVGISDEVCEVLNAGGEFFHGYTYSGHPACCAAAIANLQIMQGEKLIDRVATEIGPYLQKRWLALESHPLIGEARMKGLLGALELVPDKTDLTRRFTEPGKVGEIVRDISFKNGLVMRAVRDSLILAPPLTITQEEVDQLIDLVTATLEEGEVVLRKEKILA